MNNKIEIENGELFSAILSDSNLILRFLVGSREEIFHPDIKACYSITIELLNDFEKEYQQIMDLLLFSEVYIKLNLNITPKTIELSDWQDDCSVEIPFHRFYAAFEEITITDLRIFLQRSYDMYESYYSETQSELSSFYSNKAKIQKILAEELKRFELKKVFFNLIRFRVGEDRTKVGISLLNRIDSVLKEID